MADELIPLSQLNAAAPSTSDETTPVDMKTVDGGRRIHVADDVSLSDVFEIPKEQRTEWARKGEIGFFESLNRAGAGSLVPFVNPERAWKTTNVMSAMDRLKKNEYGDNAVLRKSDEEVFTKFTHSLAEEQTRGYSGGGKFASGIAALPAFMLEFYATGGVAAAGKEAAQKALTTLAGDFAKNRATDIAIRTAGAAAGAAARTPFASFGRIGQSYGDRQINANLTFTDKGIEISKEATEQPFTSFMKASGDSLIENFSEVTGGAIGRTISTGASHVFGRKLSVALTQMWTKLHPNESINKLFTRAGYNGFIGELGEERLGDVLRAVTGVSDFGAGDGASVMDKVVASIPSGKDWLVEAGVLAVPGAAHLGWQHAVSQMQKNTKAADNPYTQKVEGPVLTPEQLDTLTTETAEEPAAAQPADEPLGALPGGEFKPVEQSKRPTFEQRAQEILGQSVKREDVVASLQDKKVQLKLSELDEHAQQLDKTLTYLEKRKATLEKSGKDPITLVAVENTIKAQQQQFDVIDSERGDILTSIQKDIDLENKRLGITGKQLTDVGLQKQIKGFKQGVDAGRKITVEMLKEAKGGLREFLASTELNPTEKGRFLSKKEIDSIKTPQQLENRLSKISERVDEIVNERKARDLKSKIENLLSGTKPRTEAGKPIGKYTPEIQTILDRAREISKMPRAEAGAVLGQNLESLGDEAPTDEQRLENRLLDTMAGINKRNPEELAAVLNDLEALVGAGKAESLLKSFSRKEKQEADKSQGILVLTGGEILDETQKDTLLKKVSRRFRTFGKSLSSSWVNLLDQLSSYDRSSGTDKSYLSKRFDATAIEIQERFSIQNLLKDMSAKGQEIFGLKNEFQFARKIHADIAAEHSAVFKFSDGKQRLLTLSKAQLRKRWMELQDSTLAEQLVQPESNAYTPEIMEWIEAQLTPQDKEFAQAQMQFYRDYYVIVNDAYKKQYGVNLPFNENYSPIRRDIDKDIVDNPLKQEADNYSSFVPGSFKGRKKNTRPFKDLNDWEVMSRHVIQMEHFRHWADMMRDMNAFFSDGEVRRTISKQFGGDILSVIDSSIKDFKNRGRRNVESWEKAMDYLRTGKVVFALGGKVAQVPKQLTGIFGYMEFVSPTDWVKGMADFVANPAAAVKVMSQSPLIQVMDGNITQEFVGLMSSEDARRFLNDPTFKSAVNIWMSGVRYGAKAANVLGGWPVYKATLEKTGSEEKAMEAFESALARTQPTSLLSSLSQWQRGNALQRTFSMFMSAQNKYFQRELSAVRNAIVGRATPAELAKVIAIHHFIIPSLFQYIADGFKWDDEEQVRAMLTGPLNGIFILGDMLDAVVRTLLNEAAGFELDKFPQANQLFEPVEGVVKALRDLNMDDIDLESVLEAMKTLSVKAVGPATGLPTKLIFDVLPEGIDDINSGEVGRGALKLGGWAPAHIDKIYDK